MTAVWVIGGSVAAALIVLIAVVVARGITRGDEHAHITRDQQDAQQARFLADRSERRR